MAEAIAFVAATRTRILEEVARRLTPQRARIFLEGAARDLTNEVLLRTSSGRVIEARSGQLDGARALLLVSLADRGRIEVDNDPTPHGHIERYPRFDAMLAEAEASAANLGQHLDQVGGLAAIPVADLDQLVAQLAELPDAASAVLRLADGMRTVAGILRDSPYEELLTTRILQRLFASDVLHFAGAAPSGVSAAPEPADPYAPDQIVPAHAVVVPPEDGSALPTEGELEGEGVEEDIREWLEHENVPPALLSDDSFTEAFAVAPSVLPTPELVVSTAPAKHASAEEVARAPQAAFPRPRRELARNDSADLIPPHEDDDDEDAEADSIVGRPPTRIAVLAGLVGVGLVFGLFMIFANKNGEDEDEHPTPDAAIVLPDAGKLALVATPTTSTSTSAAADAQAIANIARVAPPIAGPDAPEDVRKAEQLLNSGAYTEAGKLLAGLRETRPKDPAVWVLSGQHYVDSGGRLQLAIEAADTAIGIDPKFYRAWVLKGSVLQFLGRRERAAEAYNRALAIDPSHPMSEEIRTVAGQLGR